LYCFKNKKKIGEQGSICCSRYYFFYTGLCINQVFFFNKKQGYIIHVNPIYFKSIEFKSCFKMTGVIFKIFMHHWTSFITRQIKTSDITKIKKHKLSEYDINVEFNDGYRQSNDQYIFFLSILFSI